jgi:hypothetical protein
MTGGEIARNPLRNATSTAMLKRAKCQAISFGFGRKSHWGPNSQERGLVLKLVWLFSVPNFNSAGDAAYPGDGRGGAVTEMENMLQKRPRARCGMSLRDVKTTTESAKGVWPGYNKEI